MVSVNQVVRRFKDAGFLISPDAVRLITEQPDINTVINAILKHVETLSPKPIVITAAHVNDALSLITEQKRLTTTRELKVEAVDFEIKFTFTGYKIDRSLKLVDGYSRLLIDRYQKLRRILLERPDMRYAVSLGDIRRSKGIVEGENTQQRKIATIGLVSSVIRKSKKIEITLEDVVSVERRVFNRVIAEVSSTSQAFKKAIWVAEDEVIGVIGTVNNNKIEVEDILLPGISLKPIKRPNDDIYIALISDLHVGSSKFAENKFKAFLKTIQGYTDDSKLKSIVEKLRFIIIAGDLVDGFGVYKGQEKELLIEDVEEQYKILSELLSEIPEDINIILIPGEHDASGLYVPSPPIPREFARSLYVRRNIHMLGDPSFIRIAGIDILVSHGRGLDDAIELYTLKGLTGDGVVDAMESLLIRRNLVIPISGKTPLAPYPHDFNVITFMPDIVHMGHAHIATASILHKNILLINSGSWQEQSIKQKLKGLNPSVGTCYFVNLKNMSLTKVVF